MEACGRDAEGWLRDRPGDGASRAADKALGGGYWARLPLYERGVAAQPGGQTLLPPTFTSASVGLGTVRGPIREQVWHSGGHAATARDKTTSNKFGLVSEAYLGDPRPQLIVPKPKSIPDQVL